MVYLQPYLGICEKYVRFVPEADVVFRHAWSINPLDRCTLPGFSYKPGDTTSNNHFEMVFNGFAWYLA